MKPATIFAAAMAVAACAFIESTYVPEWTRARALAKDGRDIAGKIVAITAGEFRTVTYQYEVDKRVFRGKARADLAGIAPTATVGVGAPIALKYLPKSPSISATEPNYSKPAKAWIIFGVVPIGCLLFGLLAHRLIKDSPMFQPSPIE